MTIDTDTRTKIRSALRKIWMYSDLRKKIKARSKVKPGRWKCEECGKIGKKIEVDHIVACGSTPGARGAPDDASWDGIINRMLDSEIECRNLCHKCHLEVTRKQREERKKK